MQNVIKNTIKSGIKNVPLGSLLNQKSYAQLIADVGALFTQKVTGNDSTFAGTGNWVTGIGSLQPDITTYPGELYLNITTGNNRAVKLPNIAESGKTYLLKFKAKIASGAGCQIDVGFNFATGGTYTYIFRTNTLTSEYQYYYYILSGQTTTLDLWIGVQSANNNGTKFLFNEITVGEVDVATLYNFDLSNYPIYYTDGLFSTLNKSAQPLLQLNTIGDSILANPSGTIPVSNDEGLTMRPTRLATNNVARHIYDDKKYTPATYRRLDNAIWTKSTLSGGSDFTAVDDGSIIINTSGDRYHITVQPSAYCEIVIPDGVTECAIVYGTQYKTGGVEHDTAIAVTINGGDISAYGAAILDTFLPLASTSMQNGHAIAHYTGLPSGANTIRLTKSNDTKVFAIWGAMYWNGNTIKLNNLAVGGIPIGNIYDFTKRFIIGYSLSNWIIQFPNINNAANSLTALLQINNDLLLANMVNRKPNTVVFMTTHPFGIDPSDMSPNYYDDYDTPITFRQRCTLDIIMCVITGNYFIDLFRMFDRDIISRGGTTEGGSGGIFYTSDGQHLDEDGVTSFSNFLLPKLPAIPD